MLLVIDNYDSFTFNLVQYLRELAPKYPKEADVRVEIDDGDDTLGKKIRTHRAMRPAYMIITKETSHHISN